MDIKKENLIGIGGGGLLIYRDLVFQTETEIASGKAKKKVE